MAVVGINRVKDEKFSGATSAKAVTTETTTTTTYTTNLWTQLNEEKCSLLMSTTFVGYKGVKAIIILLITLSLILSRNPCHGFLLDGSQNSFAQFRKWYTGLNGSLELEFKTEQPNGLVLYTDDGGTYDFFELKLVEGALRLRYNLGGGAQIITVGRDLHDGHWHKVQVSLVLIITLHLKRAHFF